MRVIDISDPTEPEEIGFYDTPGEALSVTVRGDLAFVADHYEGLRVINITNPRQPEEVGFYDTPGYAHDVFCSEGLIYVADLTNVGIYRFTHPDAVDDDPDNPLPTGFYLSAAYPNPFNAVTTIAYGLPVPSPVSLRMYSSSGCLMGTLVDDWQPAGYHKTVWNSVGTPAGAYFVCLEAGDYYTVLKVVLVK